MELIFNCGLIILGFILLLKGADFMVSGATSFAKKFNVSELSIGLTIVAMGTSAPELVVNLVSGSQGLNDVVFGNIIGSNIFNLFLILGLCGTIKPILVQSNTVWKEIPFSLILFIVFFLLINDSLLFQSDVNILSTIDGIILLLLFVSFLYYVFYNVKNQKHQTEVTENIKQKSNLITFLLIFGGIVGLIIGGKLVVDNSVEIARNFNVSEKLIGLTILAAGTSLPELAASVVAAYRGKADIAVGNVIGSNIFNITFILGLNSVISPLTYNLDFNFDLYFLIGGSALLFLFMFTLNKKKLDRWESILFIIGFAVYMVFIFIRK
ncbi:K+-dependent Na+/Ca+ exchanger [Marivirga lumbricoides]|uniref:K+-dependent Na+/Ca+ exchanger n=1 Tax=Marivirga lumbricoides TaxID=1046115 RepID=A0ABQ1MST5_9BACT|nr:K+-dependent Na+/Ca+ exchanger [Marivirga lumbricoides]